MIHYNAKAYAAGKLHSPLLNILKEIERIIVFHLQKLGEECKQEKKY
jgi:hypothetical protein